MPFCPNCGFDAGDERFCSNCGSQLYKLGEDQGPAKPTGEEPRYSSPPSSGGPSYSGQPYGSGDPNYTQGAGGYRPSGYQPNQPASYNQSAPPPYQGQGYHPGYQGSPYARPGYHKEPWVAVLLAFFIPGLGQVYAGRAQRGVGTFIAFCCLIYIFFIGIFVWIWGMYDAYQLIKQWNESVDRSGHAPW